VTQRAGVVASGAGRGYQFIGTGQVDETGKAWIIHWTRERHMLIASRGCHPALFISGVVTGIAIIGCTRDDGGRPVASSTIESRTPPDSTPARADTATAAPVSPPTPTNPAPTAAAKPQPKPARVRASTVPAPKAPQPPADSAAKQAASADSSVAETTPTTAGTTQNKWLSYDAATNTVTFELIAGPFTFNGYRNGEGTLVLPSKANVVMNFVNKDGTPHSAEVISGEGPVPNAAVDPAIPRAYTNKVLEGLAQEGSDVMRFTVPESGTYRIFCGVPGHGLSGMWIWMKVDASAKTPGFGPTKS
jgi:hypothetical protein